MIDNNLIGYIEQNLSKGYSDSSIQNALINQGYPAANVLDTIFYVKGNNRNTQKIPVQSRGDSKKGLYIIIPIVLVIIIGLSIFFFMSLSPKSISEEEFSQGTNFGLKENKEVKFNLDKEVHTIKIDSVNDNSVSLTIQSNPIQVDIKIGEEKKFDLNNDGFYDLLIKLNAIENGVPELHIKKIHEGTCTEDWDCGDWSSCSEAGSQTRTCTDLNSCGTIKNKPLITQSCTYVEPCTEDWNCGSWSECTEQGTQTRTCTDVNLCGPTKNKPSTTQSCTYVEKSVINPNDIILDIILPKESYTVGEEISGEYYLKYQGVAFTGVIMCTTPSNEFYKVKTTIENLDSKVSGKIGSGIGSFSNSFSYTSSKEDTYTYSISVYSCDEINNDLNRNDCGNSIDLSDMIETMKQVTSLKSKSKSITVEGASEESVYECRRDEDCTEVCENCEDGTYVCAGISTANPSIFRTCVECFISADCKWKDGYECNSDYMCVLEEEDTYEVTDPQTILDCYSEDLSERLCSPEKVEEFATTFETRLESCEISEGTFGLGFEPMVGIFRGYEILGEQDGVCSIKFWFLENSVIESSLLNKDMTCEYDSSKRTVQDDNDCFPECCSGELVDTINAQS